MALQKDEVKTIEKELDLKTIKSFLKTLDLIIDRKLSIPNLRAYVEDKASEK